MIATSTFAHPAQRAGSGTLRSLTIAGPAGKLESILNQRDQSARYAALICHPHPKGGGTMHNKVVYHAMKALNAPEFGLEWPVLRFNFRGTGLSEGEHDGTAETGDVLAALRWLESQFNRPVVVVGFSFGAAMALLACCNPSGSHVSALAALGLPTRTGDREYQYSFLSQCAIPKLFLSGACDQFATPADLERLAATTAEPKKLVLLPRADHFFSNQLKAMQNELASWLKGQLT